MVIPQERVGTRGRAAWPRVQRQECAGSVQEIRNPPALSRRGRKQETKRESERISKRRGLVGV